MYIEPPKIVKRLFPDLIWSFSQQEVDGKVFITFDDGPTPEITPWILDTLSKFDAKATFFCLGKNVEQYPELFQMILEGGHAVGNHTYSHQKGWEMRTGRYVEDVDLADNFIHSNLFRPPYGRIKPAQARRLSERYKLIMWDVLSRDYSQLVSPRSCLNNVVKHVKSGSIVLFHDSRKAYRNLSYTLPRTLEFLRSKGLESVKIEL
ncbi:MAG TPA: polysaccharide deacetylase family protein [Candidatus Avirikenella pullistercoris]|nr:polysaccharide deacetylase family protein [Candidatus Avirikenella pullistercoris]